MINDQYLNECKVLRDEIVKKYPKLFKSRWGHPTVMKGWLVLVDKCCETIQAYADKNNLPQPEFTTIKEKFGCYDVETEVLTKNGWKYFKDVTYEDEFAILNDNDYLEYSVPSDIIEYHYTGKMYKLSSRGCLYTSWDNYYEPQ